MMSNIKEILERVATDKNIKNDFFNIESISELFKICETKGYTKTKSEFESEFKELLKENRLSELNNDELLKVSGGASWNIKKIPTLVLASLIISGNISTSGFAMELNPSTSNSTIERTSEKATPSSTVESTPKIKQNINVPDFLLNLPKELKKKMIMDNKKEDPQIAPERLNFMLNSWDSMINSIREERKLDLKLYKELHDQLVGNEQGKTEWRKNVISVDLNLMENKNFTYEGLKEFILKTGSKWRTDQDVNPLVENGTFRSILDKFYLDELNISFVLENLFFNYYKALEKLESKGSFKHSMLPTDISLEDKKIEIIVRICQNLCQKHLFTYGNIDTITFLIMNKMLIENGLSPTCMHEPNNLEFSDVKTLIKQVKEGQQNFLQILNSYLEENEAESNEIYSDIQDFINSNLLKATTSSIEQFQDSYQKTIFSDIQQFESSELKSTNIDKYKDILLDLPKELKWKMVIDAKFHNNPQGELIFDKGGNDSQKKYMASSEPGYLEAMLDSWDSMIDSIKKSRKLDATLYKEFHDRAVNKVDFGSGTLSALSWKDYGHSRFGLTKNTFTSEGLKEFLHKAKSDWIADKHISDSCHIIGGYFTRYKFPKNMADYANDIFKAYYDALDELKNEGAFKYSMLSPNSSLEDKIIEIILRICQTLDQYHFFPDGNIRTIAFIVMNKMLIENGLSPTCMYEPNALDCTDIKTLIQQVKHGQKYFLNLLKPHLK